MVEGCQSGTTPLTCRADLASSIQLPGTITDYPYQHSRYHLEKIALRMSLQPLWYEGF